MSRRIFISYSHQDEELAMEVCSVIKGLDMEPLWDKDLAVGVGFPEQIRTFISHAHVFIPIITEESSRRGWVHQEIGFAVALNIPVLPVALGRLPAQMLHELHAVSLTGSEEDREPELREKLTRRSIDTLLSGYVDDTNVPYETAALAEDRARLMAAYANGVKDLDRVALLRQKGALSSLHIPTYVASDPRWHTRYGDFPKGEFHYRGQRLERIALEHHAREAGFKLIVDPTITYERYGPEARRVRLQTLIEFLESTDDDKKYQVAFYKELGLGQSVTILGDWFYAESVSVTLGQGYRQTIFTRHAASMQAKIDLFDQEFRHLLDVRRWRAEESKTRALEELREIVAAIGS